MGVEHSSEKTVLSCESGRMVIIEATDRERADNARVLALAQEGKEEGYALYSETAGGVLEADAPGLFLSILVRPMFHAECAGLLSAATAVAVARAIERVSDISVSIRWVNDLFCKDDKLAAMMTSARVKPNGHFDYAVIGITVSLPEEHFGARLGDVVRRVFNGELRPLPTRLAEAIVYEFFSIYDKMSNDRSFLTEYRERSTLIGRRVKVLLGDNYVPARVFGIGDDATLHVRLRNGTEVAVASRAEVVF